VKLGLDLVAKIVGQRVPAAISPVVIVGCHHIRLGQVARASGDVVNATVYVDECDGSVRELRGGDALTVGGISASGVERNDVHGFRPLP